MRSPITVASLLALSASAAPAWPSLNLGELGNPLAALDGLSSYFNMVASKVEQVKSATVAPQCDVSKAHMPTGKSSLLSLDYKLLLTIPSQVSGLPGPSPGLYVHHIAIGRGSQNYTCNATKPDEAPKATGAKAVLFNVTCMASMYPDLSAMVPAMAVHFNMDDDSRLGPSVLSISGHHFFNSSGVPYFNLTTPTMDIGQAPCAKNNSANAPADAPKGQIGDGAVPWLKLLAVDGATDNIREIFRVATAGGSAPKTCRDQPDHIEVEYSAQ